MTDLDAAAVIAAARDIADNGLGDVPRLAQAVELLAHCHLRRADELAALATLIEALIARVDRIDAERVAPVLPIRPPAPHEVAPGETVGEFWARTGQAAGWPTKNVVPLTEEEDR